MGTSSPALGRCAPPNRDAQRSDLRSRPAAAGAGHEFQVVGGAPADVVVVLTGPVVVVVDEVVVDEVVVEVVDVPPAWGPTTPVVVVDGVVVVVGEVAVTWQSLSRIALPAVV